MNMHWEKLNAPPYIIGVIALLFMVCCFYILIIAMLPDSSENATLATQTIDVDLIQTQAYQTVIAEFTANAHTLTQTITPAFTENLPTIGDIIATETLVGTLTSTNAPTFQPMACVPKKPHQTGLVVDIVDGDTIKVLVDGLTYSLRYIGINAPENTTWQEYYGKEATNRNAELVYAKTVKLYSDVSDKDDNGRLLRYVFVDEQFINLILIQEGFASAYRYEPDTSCASIFSAAESKPKSQKIGIWAAPPTLEYIAPLATQPASSSAVCFCNRDRYNCSDFKTQQAAQSCFNYCKNLGLGDIHRLDNDNDGLACEWSP
jgi:micrococcal nuclease